MKQAMFILYVSDQQASCAFYRTVLEMDPVLDVPGMTEFSLLDGALLGLMPEAGIQRLLGDVLPEPAFAKGVLRSEVYLLVDDPQGCLERAVDAGASLLSEYKKRDWGDWVGYCLDVDGYVLGFGRAEF